ncbi:MAG TPA: TIGR03936 family radical SAM-associated protein [Acidimicrobiia bacterium]|nr:TIGR03936 family radical SAM-associated protein [Acidimicrobiia bacterium]
MRGDRGFPVRLRFSKQGKVRFVSHRDLARGFERAFRVAELPLAFTEGFNPRPRVSLGLALGVGHESEAEYLDLELAQPIELDTLPAALCASLPVGVAVDGAVLLVPRAPALQEAITSVEYRIRPAMEPVDIDLAVERALTATELPIETTRKGRPVVEDLRPGIRRLTVVDGAVEVEVGTQPRGIRPVELVGALRELAGGARSDGEDRVLRTNQWIERDGARLEPLEADRPPRASDDARATSKGTPDVRGNDHPDPGERADGGERDARIGDGRDAVLTSPAR